MHKKMVLVTGANGQLGTELQKIAHQFTPYHFLFYDRKRLDITNTAAIKQLFKEQPISYVINCAAYTKVDAAESDVANAELINATAVGNLAKICALYKAWLIHLSTDFVFGGNKNTPFKETDPTASDLNTYAATKLAGEKQALLHHTKSIIIRTSWVYAAAGANFVKTMLRLGKERDKLRVVYDQVGSPTYAADLAAAIMHIIPQLSTQHQQHIYHYANAGVCSWFDLAVNALQLAGIDCTLAPIETQEYPTPAKRPAYSVLHTQKIRAHFGVSTPYWRNSLEKCVHLLQKNKQA